MLFRSPKKLILDVGCGPGFLEVRLKTRRLDVRLVGIDIDSEMLSTARAESGLEPVRANAAQLPFEDGSLDCVVSSASLKDWANQRAGLLEIVRVLRLGGIAYLYDFITKGPGSDPPGFARRYGTVSNLLRIVARFVIPFGIDDARALAQAVGSEAITEVTTYPDLGVVKLTLRKISSEPAARASPK